jgi:hypothetical protein
VNRRIAAVSALCALLVPALAGDEDAAPSDGPVRADDSTPTLPSARFVGPRDADGRRAALQKFGGNTATEGAIEKALDWLARH